MGWEDYLIRHYEGLTDVEKLEGLDDLPKDGKRYYLALKGKYKGEDCVIGLVNESEGYTIYDSIGTYIYVSGKLVKRGYDWA